MSKKKIAVLVDELIQMGGVERMVMVLGKRYEIDIFVGYYDPHNTFPEIKKHRIIRLLKKKPYFSHLQHILLRNAFRKLHLKQKYDAYITFGGASLLTAQRYHPTVWYCNTPIRWLYDLHKFEAEKMNPLKKFFFRIICSHIRKEDQNIIPNIDRIVANSKNVADRCMKYYKRKVYAVAHPPTSHKEYSFKTFGDFFLSTARIDVINRIDLLIHAFSQMPNNKLVIASGGADLKRITALAKSYKNIKVLGWVSEEKIKELYATCLAVVCTQYSPDYSMIPIEANASGKPCICVREGGVKETIIHNKTGVFIEPPLTIEKLKSTILNIQKKDLIAMKPACLTNTSKFSEEMFFKIMEDSMFS